MEYAKMALIFALRCSRLMSSNFFISISSAAKACTTVIPVMCSCTNAFSCATAFLTRMNDLFTLSLNQYVTAISAGNGTMQINASFQLEKNMYIRIERMDNRSAMMGTSPSLKISLMDSMSLIVLVVNVPMGVLSYCDKL